MVATRVQIAAGALTVFRHRLTASWSLRAPPRQFVNDVRIDTLDREREHRSRLPWRAPREAAFGGLRSACEG